MQHKMAPSEQKQRSSPQGPDQRFAALARLLGRDAARKEFEKELSVSPERSYDADSESGDQ